MRYREAAKPYVLEKLEKAQKAFETDDSQRAFEALEDAHVIGQYSTYFHTLVHFEMLKFGLRNVDIKEVLGQIFRLIGATTKTAIGLIPTGNTGGVNVSPFKPMKVSIENQKILNEIAKKMQ